MTEQEKDKINQLKNRVREGLNQSYKNNMDAKLKIYVFNDKDDRGEVVETFLSMNNLNDFLYNLYLGEYNININGYRLQGAIKEYMTQTDRTLNALKTKSQGELTGTQVYDPNISHIDLKDNLRKSLTTVPKSVFVKIMKQSIS
jgi:hypothetical protein